MTNPGAAPEADATKPRKVPSLEDFKKGNKVDVEALMEALQAAEARASSAERTLSGGGGGRGQVEPEGKELTLTHVHPGTGNVTEHTIVLTVR